LVKEKGILRILLLLLNSLIIDAAERNPELRDAWILKLTKYTASQLIFLDESAANERTGDRKYGWAPVGTTPYEYSPIKRSERWSILPVYGAEGFLAWDII